MNFENFSSKTFLVTAALFLKRSGVGLRTAGSTRCVELFGHLGLIGTSILLVLFLNASSSRTRRCRSEQQPHPVRGPTGTLVYMHTNETNRQALESDDQGGPSPWGRRGLPSVADNSSNPHIMITDTKAARCKSWLPGATS